MPAGVENVVIVDLFSEAGFAVCSPSPPAAHVTAVPPHIHHVPPCPVMSCYLFSVSCHHVPLPWTFP